MNIFNMLVERALSRKPIVACGAEIFLRRLKDMLLFDFGRQGFLRRSL